MQQNHTRTRHWSLDNDQIYDVVDPPFSILRLTITLYASKQCIPIDEPSNFVMTFIPTWRQDGIYMEIS
jgi:hypothetical protein